MNVELAKTAGFCFGVKRAVDTVYQQIEQYRGEKIFTYGPIIHNEEVIKDLRSHGVEVLNDEEELKTADADVVVIRSHGVAKYIYDIMEERGITCVDATCPFVKKIHKIVAEKSAEGSYIVIVGNGEHPEVQGIRGWAGEQVTVVQTQEDAERFELPDKDQKVCIVAQTTFNYNKFKELVEIISKKRYDIVVLNTICNATKERQTEARQIAARVDAMVVIGDKRSSNTQKLFEICKEECLNTYYIQTLDDLDINQLRSVESVGITAGASTPNKIIEEVQNNVRINF
ncbi:4-hydroxy-3-methylbut-2-enyl diphosphate reductase [Dorea longicatena]|jgi:4-hydroxy-3-methylbut-2-enyl diphosphate reductase|uniref:4-hydroxy-3-methylbut-2-enyl diphosphate reductase n=1 Tax=Dorea longicatena TaxID=88431 RepID=A0A414S020_9FIRM|nr:4-hydroxy-3-methylbut-2-enyl diphosphate reductase [Dorea longicatena]RHG06007.1 4-hydroxy-3-methylbut-2-enyl diphosphate reductase [Dorea longicatena]UTB44215.1 4-hydroxy-3-methylbut-2-enyl diphosphate reductase [Dorea longicatena]